MIWITLALVPLAFLAGRYWPKPVRTMPSFLVQWRSRIMRGQLDVSDRLWDAVSGLVGNPSFHVLFAELYGAHVWKVDETPETDTNLAMVKQGARKAVIDLATILTAAENYQKEKHDAAQGHAAERDS